MLKLRMNSIIQKSSDAYEIGTITYNPDSDCSFSSGNKIYKFGNIGILRLIITTLPATSGSKTRTIINSMSIKPVNLQSVNVALRNSSSQAVEGYINIDTNGSVQICNIDTINQQAVRELIVFPLV